jgi:hypothetical protein
MRRFSVRALTTASAMSSSAWGRAASDSSLAVTSASTARSMRRPASVSTRILSLRVQVLAWRCSVSRVWSWNGVLLRT